LGICGWISVDDKDFDVFYENVEGAADVEFLLVFAVACDVIYLTLFF
jgi:hypothetical protein